MPKHSVELDAGQEHRQFEVPDRIGLLLDVLRAQVVSGSPEHVFECHREIVAEDVILVANIAVSQARLYAKLYNRKD
jgi:hypothetical protein